MRVAFFFVVSQSEEGVQNDASLADAGIVSLTIPLTGADIEFSTAQVTVAVHPAEGTTPRVSLQTVWPTDWVPTEWY